MRRVAVALAAAAAPPVLCARPRPDGARAPVGARESADRQPSPARLDATAQRRPT